MAYSDRIKAECLAEWLNGKSMDNISEEKGIPIRTLERWSSAGKWVEQKTVTIPQLTEAVLEATVETREQFKERIIQQLEEQIGFMLNELPKCKTPTMEKQYAIILDGIRLLCSLKGIPFDQKLVGVVHGGEVKVTRKLEDLITGYG
jgi:hypothetical protein